MPVKRPLFAVVLGAGYGLGGTALLAGSPGRVTIAAAFLLPAAVTLTDVLLRGLCIRHPIGEPGSPDALPVYDAIMLRFGVFIMGVHATVLAGLLGLLAGRDWAGQIVPVMLGLVLISIGNLLPRTRPNLALGIRTRRTLTNRAAWIRTHRSTGYVTVATGAVILLSAIAVPPPIGRTMVLAVAPAALMATWFVVRRTSKHVRGDR
jgi:immunity protein, SdpI family